MATTKAQATERDEAIARLRDWIKPGDTVYTILDHVSSSGMSRAIRAVLLQPYRRCSSCRLDLTEQPGREPKCCLDHPDAPIETGTTDLHPNHAIGLALGIRHWKRNGREQDALVVGGCGMDMGFHLVYELSHTLYGGRLTRDIYLDSATHDEPGGQLLTREGAPEGQVWIGGYRCLGQGKCPSNYHTNYRSRLRCDGPKPGSGLYGHCYAPDPYSSRFPMPEDWPQLDHVITLDDGTTETLHTPASCCTRNEAGEEIAPIICPACEGQGDYPNPDGPQRFDLVHTDGYALRHRWL